MVAEGTKISPGNGGGRAVDDHARALSLVVAAVHLPWFGPDPGVGGEVSLSAAFACDRRTVAPGAVSLSCRPDGPATADSTEHLRASLGIRTVTPPDAGDFSDPS